MRRAVWALSRCRSQMHLERKSPVCSTSKLELVRSIGAHDVIDYTLEDFADRVDLYDVILDTAGRRSLSNIRRALAPNGILVIVGG